MVKESNYSAFRDSCTVNINGDIVPPERANISIFDRGFLYGDSIYEVTYSENRSLIFFEDHLNRLYNSAALLGINIFISKDEIISQSLKTLEHSNLDRAYIRIILTRGETEIGLDPSNSFKNNLVIIVKPQPPYPDSQYEMGLKLFLSNVVRNNREALDPNAKSGNYLNNVLAIKEAKNQGFDDAIMVNGLGKITEGTSFNIWMVKDSEIFTPPVSSGLLKGITRDKVLDIAKDLNLNPHEREFEPDFLMSADEVFITSSTKGIMPIRQISDTKFGESITSWPMTQNLRAEYLKRLEAERSKKEFSY